MMLLFAEAFVKIIEDKKARLSFYQLRSLLFRKKLWFHVPYSPDQAARDS